MKNPELTIENHNNKLACKYMIHIIQKPKKPLREVNGMQLKINGMNYVVVDHAVYRADYVPEVYTLLSHEMDFMSFYNYARDIWGCKKEDEVCCLYLRKV